MNQLFKRLREFEHQLVIFSDKYQLINRGMYLGLAINGVLIYQQLMKLTALKRMQEYLDEKTKDFEKRREAEYKQILEDFKE